MDTIQEKEIPVSVLSDPIFHDEKAAYEYVESILWPDGPICPKCGVLDNAYILNGKRARPGLMRCKDCKKDFTVKVSTVFEASHVSMCHWLQATYLLTASKKGFSAHQLHRMLGCTYKTAWFVFHRLREAMRDGDLTPFGSNGGTVEVDETFIGNDRTLKPNHTKKGRGYHHKHKILTLVDRSTGRAKSIVVDDLKAKTLFPILKENIAKESTVCTDEAGQYRNLAREFAQHDFVRHGAGEYGRGEVHTNTAEGYFSIFKRGMKGVYQHCAKKHLHRYAAEFDFRYNHRSANGFSDSQRADSVLSSIRGKRITYRGSSATA